MGEYLFYCVAESMKLAIQLSATASLHFLFFFQKYVVPVSQSLLMRERHSGKDKLLEGEKLPPSCLEAVTGNHKYHL